MSRQEQRPELVLCDVRLELAEQGFDAVWHCSPWDPAGAVLLAEAANLAAKTTDRYDLKVAAFAAAAQLDGVESGWGYDGCFYLRAEGAGEVCAHDPFGELYAELVRWEVAQRPNRFRLANRRWYGTWGGVYRQRFAFEALSRRAVRRVLDWGTTEEGVRPATVMRVLTRLTGIEYW